MSEDGSSQSFIDERNRRRLGNSQGTVRQGNSSCQGLLDELDRTHRARQQVQSQIRPIARSRSTINDNKQHGTARQVDSREQRLLGQYAPYSRLEQQFQSLIRPTATPRNTLNVQHQIAPPQRSTNQNHSGQLYVPPQRRQDQRDSRPLQHRPEPQLYAGGHQQRPIPQMDTGHQHRPEPQLNTGHQHRPEPQSNTGHQHRHGNRGLSLNQLHSSSIDLSRFRENDRNSAKEFRNHKNDRDGILNEDQDHNRQKNRRVMGFGALREIANADPRDAIAKVNARKDSFLQLINSNLNDNRDMIFLVVQILSKVSLSSFDELKSRLLLEVCFTEFVTNLRIYLMDLPYHLSQKARNKLYWDNQEIFWENFITFSESIFDIAPSVTLNKCRPLIEATSNYCLMELKTKHEFNLSAENQTRLTSLHKKFTEFEQKDAEEEKQRNRYTNKESADCEPPEDFRQLSVVPTRADLLEGRPFVRANVVRGAYRDAEHYLDVQFRLLREDCFGPVRIGLQQYLEDPNKKEYDNIRVYRDVKFTGPYVGKNHIGVTAQLGANSMKRLKRINWSHSKRFIYGSLLLFTNDYCQSFIATIIIDRDIKCLADGKLPVRIIENPDSLEVQGVNYNSTYIMIESEVYFEPYQHVLKALQEPSFPRHLSMSQYIVKTESKQKPPSYITNTSIYSVKVLEGHEVKFNVLNPSTWPLPEELGFNESQYEAYRLALTHEFAVIQGPPGTGKTFIGAKVAKTLINNSANIKGNTSCLMLVICYTNHALDQFLEHILTITKSVVRIGSQSKNPAMESISINTLIKTSNLVYKKNTAQQLYKTERNTLSLKVNQLQNAQNRIKSLTEGIIFYSSLQAYVPEAMVLRQYYTQTKRDIIDTWLFENMPYTNVQEVLELNVADDDGGNVPLYTDNNRTAHVADELWDINDGSGVEVNGSTILLEQKLKQLISYYKNNTNKIGSELLDEIHIIHSRMTFFKEMRDTYRANGVPREIRRNEDLSRLSNVDRWSIYLTWVDKVIKILIEETKPLQDEVDSAVTSCEEAKMMLDLNLLLNTKVVGMTTSGAARQRKLLKALGPQIVIVEEAAEVLEQHIVTSLTASCKHLILIGDHQQLRPSVAFMRLARHYGIDVSLFERMVLNGVHSRRLGVQHRMRPEIAALVAPHIYADLANHPSVGAYPHVRGLTSDLFFFTHDYKEDTTGDSTIQTNQKEADMVLGLANYLMQQDYELGDVTILTFYVGQLFYMKKQSQKYAFLRNVKITVVDNYQGEESKIILLSLVRNNDQNKIGFLATDNRICVALSRAKEGFYLFGNIKTLKSNSTLWTNVAKTLEDKGSIGTELRLKCENHPNQFTTITTVEHFNKVPEGGCLLKCNYNLRACLHRCPRLCHGYDRDHTDRTCEQKCERIICDLGHVCPLLCGEKCQSCRLPVTKTLPCGHDKQIACCLQPDDPTVKCNVVLDVILPECGHQTKKQCHLPLNSVRCTVPCTYRLDDCGHACRRHCHVTDDPDHVKYECKQPCARAKKGCSANVEGDRGHHQCLKLCHEACGDCIVLVTKKRSKCKHTERVKCSADVDEEILLCTKNCARMLPCSHFCKRKCYETCGGCKQLMEKTIPECKHTIKIACDEEARHEMCRQPCERRFSCGHRCGGRCGAPCDAAACAELIPDPVDSPCGHKVMSPCNVYRKRISDPLLLLNHCTEPCNAVLKCDHVCAGTCAQCRQGRLHAPCTQPCRALNICGHQCEEPCNQLCPPCEKPCEVKCDHSRCPNICGAPCVPCQEKCGRACVHGACSRRCGEACSRAACAAACARALPCGHACRGLCGEPCPPICRVCSPESFPKDFLGDDFDEDAKFIKLQDCSHILEVEDADNLMQGDKETISIRSCPFCRKPIINTYRYKDTVNQMYKTEINPIKERVYGTKAQVEEKRTILISTLEKFQNTHKNVLKDNIHIQRAYQKLCDTFRRHKKISKLQIDMHDLYIKILDMIGEKYEKFIAAKLTTTYFDDQVQMLCIFLSNNIQKISQQQQEDIGNEIKRLHSIHQLSLIKTQPSYKLYVEVDPKVREAEQEAEACVISFNIFEELTAVTALKTFAKAINSSTVITPQERQMIHRAMGFKQGHWFKCPNGHIYCITECGGAMEVQKCYECKEEIGGRRHTLLQTNKVASEMDGAKFAAWSEHNNNMANFNFDNII